MGRKKREIITWVDSRSVEGWVTVEEIDRNAATIETIGHIVFEDKKHLCVAGSRGKQLGQYCSVIIIPKVCITKRKKKIKHRK